MPDTYVNAVSGEEILVQIGDDADPQVFAHDCMINTDRSINLTATTSDQQIPNCTDPSKPPKTVRRVDATDSTISGAGLLHKDSALVWAQRVGKTISIRGRIAGALRVAGLYILTEFAITGTARQYSTASITLVQADQPEITADAG